MTGARIALVDGVPAARHARQLLLRAEGFDVRAYANATRLLADPLAQTSICLVAEVEMPDIGGVALVHALRAQGWNGTAILLADKLSAELAVLAIEQDFAVVEPSVLGDRLLLAKIHAAVARR